MAETINADPGPANRAGLKIVTLEPRRIDWWSSGVQLVGTVFFNVTTFRAFQTSLESTSYDQLVAAGCAGLDLAFCPDTSPTSRSPGGCGLDRRTLESRIVTVNLLGCIAFGSLQWPPTPSRRLRRWSVWA